MKNKLSDKVIEGCKNGDRWAQTELYKKYNKGMYSVSMRILNNSAEAEDAMQEAFIAAFKQIDTFKGEVTFGSWLKKIVINRSIDLLRKRKIHYDNLTDLSETLVDNTENTFEEITPKMVKEAIAELKDNYRIVLSLFLLEGYDHDEIAEILKISNGSSRIIYHRAKLKLQEKLVSKKIQYSEV